MPENLPGMIISSAFAGIGILALARVLLRALKNRNVPVKTVKAVVIDKQKTEYFSQYSGNGRRTKYVVVFLVDGRKKSFYVSEFSYNSYRVNQKGKLKYKGDRLIEFG